MWGTTPSIGTQKTTQAQTSTSHPEFTVCAIAHSHSHLPFSIPSKCSMLPTQQPLRKAQDTLQKSMYKSLKVESHLNSPCSITQGFVQVISTDSKLSALEAMLWALLQPPPLFLCLPFLFASVPGGFLSSSPVERSYTRL